MKKEDFIAAGMAAFGGQWQTEVSQELGVNVRTVRSWVSGKYRLPPTISADLKLMLERRKKLIEEAIVMSTEKFLMNPVTGSVDTEENWIAEMGDWEESDGKSPQEQLDSLVEVVKSSDGQWVEA